MKPILINNLEFAQKQEKLKGKLKIKQCERLLEALAPPSKAHQDIHYELQGHRDKLYLPSLHLSIVTTLPVVCQRCLTDMTIKLSLTFNYLVGDTEPEDDGDEVDWLEASREMDLVELIEDELIVAMPISPVHDRQCTEAVLEAGEKPNPFAVLKGRIN